MDGWCVGVWVGRWMVDEWVGRQANEWIADWSVSWGKVPG